MHVALAGTEGSAQLLGMLVGFIVRFAAMSAGNIFVEAG